MDIGAAARLWEADGRVENDGGGAGIPGDKGFALVIKAKGGSEVIVRHIDSAGFNIGAGKAQAGVEANHKVCIGIVRANGSLGDLAGALAAGEDDGILIIMIGKMDQALPFRNPDPVTAAREGRGPQIAAWKRNRKGPLRIDLGIGLGGGAIQAAALNSGAGIAAVVQVTDRQEPGRRVIPIPALAVYVKVVYAIIQIG